MRAAPVSSVHSSFYTVPTASFGEPRAETDGTARWDSTGVLVVEIEAAGTVGLGYSYTGAGAHRVLQDTLSRIVVGCDPFDTSAAFWQMAAAVRNLGWPGVCASAISAIDLALHDLKGRLLDVSAVQLLGGARREVMAYGSGGFTNYGLDELLSQLGDWAQRGMRAVKMKIGSSPDDDLQRVGAAREALGPDVELFVDANGAYNRKQAIGFAHRFADLGVSWFEEPVSSEDLTGLRVVRDASPGGMQIAAGEYGYTPAYFHAMLAANAVDSIQADSTRCGGATGFLSAVAQAHAAGIPLSAHTAPAVHASLGASQQEVVHVEYFHDHARIEELFFDGNPNIVDGSLVPHLDRAGFGLTLKSADAAEYLIEEWRSS